MSFALLMNDCWWAQINWAKKDSMPAYFSSYSSFWYLKSKLYWSLWIFLFLLCPVLHCPQYCIFGCYLHRLLWPPPVTCHGTLVYHLLKHLWIGVWRLLHRFWCRWLRELGFRRYRMQPFFGLTIPQWCMVASASSSSAFWSGMVYHRLPTSQACPSASTSSVESVKHPLPGQWIAVWSKEHWFPS